MSFSLFRSEKHHISWCALLLSSQRGYPVIMFLACLQCLVWQVMLSPNCSFSLVKLKQQPCFVVLCQSSTTAELCESCLKTLLVCAQYRRSCSSVQPWVSFYHPDQSLIMPRHLLSTTDRGASHGLSQTCWGRCPPAGQWMHFFPLTCSDSLKRNNFNCMLQDVFNLSLDFNYFCILFLCGKLCIC